MVDLNINTVFVWQGLFNTLFFYTCSVFFYHFQLSSSYSSQNCQDVTAFCNAIIKTWSPITISLLVALVVLVSALVGLSFKFQMKAHPQMYVVLLLLIMGAVIAIACLLFASQYVVVLAFKSLSSKDCAVESNFVRDLIVPFSACGLVFGLSTLCHFSLTVLFKNEEAHYPIIVVNETAEYSADMDEIVFSTDNFVRREDSYPQQSGS